MMFSQGLCRQVSCIVKTLCEREQSVWYHCSIHLQYTSTCTSWYLHFGTKLYNNTMAAVFVNNIIYDLVKLALSLNSDPSMSYLNTVPCRSTDKLLANMKTKISLQRPSLLAFYSFIDILRREGSEIVCLW